MRRMLSFTVAILFFCVSALSQNVKFHAGVQVGTTVNKLTTLAEDFKGKALAGWHAGLTAELKLPAFFAIQPSVIYDYGRSRLNLPHYDKVDVSMGSINIPIAIQWGPDLGIIRPYIQLVPFADIMLNGKCSFTDLTGDLKTQNIMSVLNRAQFGLGLGAGLEFWRMQLSLRYNWVLTDWNQANAEGNQFRELSNRRRGVMVSLAFLMF